MNWLKEEKNGVYLLTDSDHKFEESYLSVRSLEGRVLSDDLVSMLPRLPQSHPLHREWKRREHSMLYFQNYISTKDFQSVLDIGCGNGWGTQHIARWCKNVVGLDLGIHELEQAARCNTQSNVQYVCCKDWSLIPDNSFDLIHFSGSFQYFELDDNFWQQLERILIKGGEIHILDTPFYKDHEQASARQRSDDYFKSLESDMEHDYYKHQRWSDLRTSYSVMFKPRRVHRIFKFGSPFPWLRLQFD